jgi:LacI family transcriptional regulator
MKKEVTEQTSGVKEIARRGNVSIATVDRVIHNRTGVSEKTKRKINKIIADLNYQPNLIARTLASRKVFDFAVLIPHVSDESDYWSAPLSGIEKAAAELQQFRINIHPFLFDQNDKDSFIKQVELVLKLQPDGVLVAPFFIAETVSLANRCDETGIPYVFINSDIPDLPSTCYIGPDLYQSGFLSGELIDYIAPDPSKILVVNVSKEIKAPRHNRLLRKEEGLRSYFKQAGKAHPIVKTDIRNTTDEGIRTSLSRVFRDHPDIRSVFVSNSRVGSVASFIEQSGREDIFLLGFDFLEGNIAFLKKGIIDFLICNRPLEQGYRGIMSLYRHVVMNSSFDPQYLMPIDIVTRQNCNYYKI